MNPALEKRIKRQIIGKPHRFLAVVPLGFENTLVQELQSIGIETLSGIAKSSDGKVEFTAKITETWKAVAYSRIANRILMHIADFKAENFHEFEKKASEIPWELYLPCHPEQSNARCEVEGSISIHVTCKHSRLYHSDAIAERLQKIIDEGNAPSQNLYVNFLDDRCTIWLDLAGEELYKRGFERFVNDAPLKETIAAGMIFEAIKIATTLDSSTTPSRASLRMTLDVSPDSVPGPQCSILDLMSGSGTFSLEAAYMASGLIPGICRDFALKHQPAFKEATWNYIIKQQEGVILSKRSASKDLTKIITSDISAKSIEIIKHNVESSPLAGIVPSGTTPIVNPQLKDFFSYTAKEIAEICSATSPVIVLNPPYGKRLDFDAPKLYTKIGRHLTTLASEFKDLGKSLTIAILAPKDDSREGSKFTCTANLLRECTALDPNKNSAAKLIETSHGGFSLNTFIARI